MSRLALGNLGEVAFGGVSPERRAMVEVSQDALDLLIRLFLFDVPVPQALLVSALGRDTVEALAATGVVATDGRHCLPELSLLPCDGLYLATDRRPLDRAINQVMWLYPESFDLVRAAIRRPGQRVLDLCTGSGIHALAAVSHGEQAFGVDISPRALNFCAFNAALNRLDDARFEQGDLFAPALNQPPFDLILANPPYNPVLDSPAGANCYSGGESGEEILSRIVAGLPACLSEAGYAQIVTLLVFRSGETLEAKLRGWLGTAGAAFDILVLSEPMDYVRGLPLELVRLGFQTAEDLQASWRRQRIESFEFGIISLRRNGRGRFRKLPPTAGHPMALLNVMDGEH